MLQSRKLFQVMCFQQFSFLPSAFQRKYNVTKTKKNDILYRYWINYLEIEMNNHIPIKVQNFKANTFILFYLSLLEIELGRTDMGLTFSPCVNLKKA